jgi:hypothetical protein
MYPIDCATSCKNIDPEKILCGEEHRDQSFFAPTACLILGITSAAEQADFFEDAMVCTNEDSWPVATPSESFVSYFCKILNISFAASTRATF